MRKKQRVVELLIQNNGPGNHVNIIPKMESRIEVLLFPINGEGSHQFLHLDIWKVTLSNKRRDITSVLLINKLVGFAPIIFIRTALLLFVHH